MSALPSFLPSFLPRDVARVTAACLAWVAVAGSSHAQPICGIKQITLNNADGIRATSIKHSGAVTSNRPPTIWLSVIGEDRDEVIAVCEGETAEHVPVGGTGAWKLGDEIRYTWERVSGTFSFGGTAASVVAGPSSVLVIPDQGTESRSSSSVYRWNWNPPFAEQYTVKVSIDDDEVGSEFLLREANRPAYLLANRRIELVCLQGTRAGLPPTKSLGERFLGRGGPPCEAE